MIVFPDVEAAVVQYLSKRIDAHVGAVELPDLDQQITVRNDGGTPRQDSALSEIRIGLNVFGPTVSACERLAAMVSAHLNEWNDLPVVTCAASNAFAVADAASPNYYIAADVLVLGTNN